MSNLDQEFRDWMDQRKLRAQDVGRALDVSAQTIRNWRSASIPPRKQDAVRRIMKEWDHTPAAQIGPRITIHATDNQFRAWNLAANDCEGGPKTIEDWARDGLDEMAREHFNDPQMKLYLRSMPPASKVADDVAEYKVTPKTGNGGSK